MKGFVKLIAVVVTAAAFAVSCSKDKDSGAVSFDKPAVFIDAPSGMATVGFTLRNIKTLSVTSQPTGWDEPMLDQTTGMLTVIAPSATVVLAGVTPGGTSVSGVLFVGVVKTVDLSAAGVANSYMASVKETNYLFDVMHKGDGSPLATDHLGVIWKSASGLVQYLQMEDGKASFYIGADTEDSDKILKGNAVIGAYDANDELIWSWHVWATDYDPEGENGSVELNGYTMMTRNLGALANGNATTSEILASYGLYYQWGRKDPFIGPSTYKISSGQGAAMYNDSGSRTYVTMVASSAETGTMDYAVKHPLAFVTGVAESNNDWLWSKSDAGWSSDGDAGAKSVNDPCPYGWRVAPSAAFAGLEIVGTPAAGDEEKFGWTLTDGKAESFFMGGGRRRYDDGKIQNIYIPCGYRAALGGTLLDYRRGRRAVERASFLVREAHRDGRHRACRSVCPRQRHAGALREGGEYVDDRYARQDNGPACCRPVVVWYNSCGVGR